MKWRLIIKPAMSVVCLALICALGSCFTQGREPAEITVSPSDNLVTTEGGAQDTFAVALNVQPDGTVVINVESSDSSEGTVDTASLSFTTSDWATAQTVMVTGLDDLLADGSQTYSVMLTVNTGSTTDTTGYAELDPDDVSVTNLGSPILGYTLTEVTGTIASADPITTPYMNDQGDDNATVYDMPWSFPFYDNYYPEIGVDTNANLWMSDTGSSGYEFDLPTSDSVGEPVIAVWNCDLTSYYFGNGVDVQAKTSPDRVVVNWDTETYDDGDYELINNFSAVLYPNGYILFHYYVFDYDLADDYGSGVSNADGVNYVDQTAAFGDVFTLGGRSFLYEPLFASGDTDNDGLKDAEETNARSDPSNPDTDGDGLKDGWEVYITGTDPLT